VRVVGVMCTVGDVTNVCRMAGMPTVIAMRAVCAMGDVTDMRWM
jgi:hypothetical protein